MSGWCDIISRNTTKYRVSLTAMLKTHRERERERGGGVQREKEREGGKEGGLRGGCLEPTRTPTITTTSGWCDRF